MTTRNDDQRPAETTTATGDQWVIGHGHQRAVVTETGATLRSFTVGERAVVDGFGPEEWSHGGRGQVLAPWPNRLGDGRYSFEGVDAQAALDEPARGNAIHGLVRWRPWQMASRAQNRVTMATDLRPSPAYPFALGLQVEYRLGRDGLTVVAEAENLGGVPLPFGIGFHPYLTVGTPTVDSAQLRVPAERTLVTDDRGLPTGEVPVSGTELDLRAGLVLGSTRLDTAYTGLLRDGDGQGARRSGRAGRRRGDPVGRRAVWLRDDLHRRHARWRCPPAGGGGGADVVCPGRIPIRCRTDQTAPRRPLDGRMGDRPAVSGCSFDSASATSRGLAKK